MTKKSNNKLVLILSGIFFLIFFVFLLENPYPSDKELIQKFDQNTDAFQEFLELLEEDSEISRISIDGKAIDHSMSDLKLNQQRFDHYKNLMGKIQIIEIHRSEKNANIYLQAWKSEGFFIGGNYKGYTYQKSSPENIVNSLDELYRTGNEVTAYKSLKENWYLYLDVW